MLKIIVLGLFFSFLGLKSFAQSQYFGQDKPRNKANNFKILESTHFQLYNYLKEPTQAKEFIKNSEYWYKLHQDVFKLDFLKPNPNIGREIFVRRQIEPVKYYTFESNKPTLYRFPMVYTWFLGQYTL
jgi:hypothetical protein